MDINTIANAGAQATLPATPAAPRVPQAAVVQPKSQFDDADFANKIAAVDEAQLNELETRRYEQVKRASQGYVSNMYPVSDDRFTIFKDTSGQFITRITSLRDGKVTYIPEYDILKYQQDTAPPARESLVEIKA